ncbi:PTS system mannose/fructose/sorbose family transporter subunit IID [Candidatus Latescibacterota bacterium]
MDTFHITENRLSFKTLLRIFLRSFFLQGSFSTKYRQNVGFAFCIEPVCDELWTDPESKRNFLIRHSEYFNGNPFMATLILGAVANMEEHLRYDKGMTESEIIRFKKVAGPATGSVGDRFFWSNLRPFGIILGLLSTFFCGVWGFLIFLAVFNIPMIIIKWYWLWEGYKLGPNVVSRIKSSRLESAERIMEIVGSILIAFFSVIVIFNFTGASYSFNWIWVCALGMFIFSLIMLKLHLPVHKLFPYVIFISVLLCLVINTIIL